MWEGLAQDLGIKEVPDLYTINGNGLLNAYASCVPGFRHFSAIYSDILETCVRNEDWDSLKFILGHEAGHIRLRHVEWWYLLFTSIYNLPPLSYIIGLPMSRAREYGCDKVGHALVQDHDCKGLLMLTAGKHLYNNLDLAGHVEESVEQGGLWSTVVNFMASHPILAWRVNAIRKGHNGGIFLRRKEVAPGNLRLRWQSRQLADNTNARRPPLTRRQAPRCGWQPPTARELSSGSK